MLQSQSSLRKDVAATLASGLDPARVKIALSATGRQGANTVDPTQARGGRAVPQSKMH